MLGRAKWIDLDLDGARASVERSLSLAPNYSFGFYNSAILNAIHCDGKRAETHVASALARSPIDPHRQTMLGTRALAAFVREDGEAALAHVDEALATPNAHAHVYLIAAGVYATYGDAAKASVVVNALHERQLSLETSGFRKHFDLQDEGQKARLFGTLERLGA